MLKNIFSARKAKNQDNEPVEKTTEQKKLDNVIGFAKNAFHLSVTRFNDTNHNKIYDFIRMLADKINYEYVQKTITGEPNYHGLDFKDLFIPVNHELNLAYDLSNQIFNDIHFYHTAENFEIELGKDPVLSFPWVYDRLIDAVKNFATDENPWIEKTNNHEVTVMLPVGITWIQNGIHSAFSGCMSRQGKIGVTSQAIQSGRHTIINLAPLYEYIKFDGENYIFTGYGEEEQLHEVIGKAPNFELGCIFEIGRLLHEKGVTFKKIQVIK